MNCIVCKTQHNRHILATARCTQDVCWWVCDFHAVCCFFNAFRPLWLGAVDLITEDEARALRKLLSEQPGGLVGHGGGNP